MLLGKHVNLIFTPINYLCLGFMQKTKKNNQLIIYIRFYEKKNKKKMGY